MAKTDKPIIGMTAAHFERFIEAMERGITPSQLIDSEGENKTLPSLSALYKYMRDDIARKATYVHAREACADIVADQVINIADTTLDPQRASNKMKARQWWASKIKPKVYGDKLDLEVTGRVDVSAAILEARKRAMLPGIESEVIDVTPADPFS